jgi:glycerate kinase
MRILAAFDKCKDSLSAREICALAQKVVFTQSVTHEIECAPLTDGGEGFVQLLTEQKKWILPFDFGFRFNWGGKRSKNWNCFI